ncbi:DUF1801 domain-containing protein [Candidatus Dojkabacteria bacterium]|uniref:DUF1801 domain-containing protein n=1 Tax=Candidatus Dojkabacteria bacterium TaxID=2099670 RepID=A0A955RL78_9BACT|nr:DUF1801 domain-containing protein [Candidatus Dojkabacteria bacterium]
MNKELEKYISSFDKEVQEKLQTIRKICLKVFPEAEEGFKWGKPAYSLKRVLIVYAAYKNHIGFYPTPEVLEEYKEEIKEYKSAKGSVQFPYSKPFPKKLIEKMVKARYKNYIEKDAKWKDPKQC